MLHMLLMYMYIADYLIYRDDDNSEKYYITILCYNVSTTILCYNVSNGTMYTHDHPYECSI